MVVVRTAYTDLDEYFKETYHLGDVGADGEGGMILKSILEK
jgi:hypothetical protein